MSPLLWRSLWRHLLYHPWQLGLAVLGIALGVAVVLAVDLANDSARHSFQLASDQLTGRATHRIVSDGEGVAESWYVKLRVDAGIRASAPVVTGHVLDSDDKTYQLLGVDPLVEGVFRDFGESETNTDIDFLALLREPNSAILPRDAGSIEALEIQLGGKRIILQGVGQLVDPALDGLIITDIATAQELFDKQGLLSHIDLILSADQIGERELARIRAILPTDLRLETTAARSETTLAMSAAFSLNLKAMSLLALLVGMFLIYNTMAFAVVQRRRLLGLLRALGVSRRELFIAILGEALLLGIVGTVLGSVLGIWLGTLLVGLVTRTINDLYYVLSVTQFSIAPVLLLKAVSLGLIVSLIAAWLPAREAAAAPPGAVISRADLEARWRAGLPHLVWLGLTLLAMGSVLLGLSSSLIGGFVGLFVIILAAAVLTPPLMVGLIRLIAWLAVAPRSAMALRGVVRHLSRTGVAVAALMVAFAATVGVGVMVDSFRAGVIVWIGDLLSADVYIAPVNEGSGTRAALAPEILQQLRDDPMVAEFSSYRGRSVRWSDTPVQLLAIEAAKRSWYGYSLLTGKHEQAWAAFQAGEGVLISEPLAYRHRLGLADTLTLNSPSGPGTFTVAGVFHDYGSEHGRIILPRAVYARLWRDSGISSVAVFAVPGSDLDLFKQHLERNLVPLQAIRVRGSRVLFERTLEVFERTFTITSVLRLLAVLVAVVGMLSALMAQLLERNREFAVLRALGMTTGEIGWLVTLQTAVMGLIAGLLAIPVGLGLALMLVYVINRRAFGWSLPFQVDPMLLAQAVLLAVVAALLAVVYPLWRQRRVAVAQELRED